MSDAPNDPAGVQPQRPVPIAHEHERPFWSGGARHELTVQRCVSCGRYNHPPSLRCRFDRHAELEWTVVSGRGRVDGWSVNMHQWLPGFPAPYVVALVALAEDPGARILTNLVGVDPDDIRPGMDVQVTFVRSDPTDGDGSDADAAWIPLFEPVAER